MLTKSSFENLHADQTWISFYPHTLSDSHAVRWFLLIEETVRTELASIQTEGQRSHTGTP